MRSFTYRDAIIAARKKEGWTPLVKTWGSVTNVVAFNLEQWKKNDYRFRLIRWKDGHIIYQGWIEAEVSNSLDMYSFINEELDYGLKKAVEINSQ